MLTLERTMMEWCAIHQSSEVWSHRDPARKEKLRAARRLVKVGLGRLTTEETHIGTIYGFQSYLASAPGDAWPHTPDAPEVGSKVAEDVPEESAKHISEVSSPDPEYRGDENYCQVPDSYPGLSPEEKDERAASQPITILNPKSRKLHPVAGGAPDPQPEPTPEEVRRRQESDLNQQLVARFPKNYDHFDQRDSLDDDPFSGENIAIAELLWEKLLPLHPPYASYPSSVVMPVPYKFYRQFCRCEDENTRGFYGPYEFKVKAFIQEKWGVDASILAIRNLTWHFMKEKGSALTWLEDQPDHVDIIPHMLTYVVAKGGEWYDEPTTPYPVTEIQHPLGLDLTDPKVQAVVKTPPLTTWGLVGKLGLRRLWSTKDDPLGNIRELRRHRDPKREKARQDKVKMWEAARAQRSGVLHLASGDRLNEGRVSGAGKQ